MTGCEGHAAIVNKPGVEEWEIPIGRSLVPHLEQPGRLGLPSRPCSIHAAPADAVEALGELVGITERTDLLVLPPVTRPSDRGAIWGPDQVLGAGRRGVALWVDDLPFPRVVAALSYCEMDLVEHVLEGEYNRVTMLAGRHRLCLHYRRDGWPPVRDILTRVRAAMAGTTQPVTESTTADAPTWDSVLSSPLVLLTGPRAEIELSVDEGGRHHWWHTAPRSAGKAALTGHELVVLRPGPDSGRSLEHGLDLIAVPRARITSIAASGPRLTVSATGVDYQITIGSSLAEAIAHRVGPGVGRPARTVTAPGTATPHHQSSP
jgi:hypothetical protein